MSCLSGVLLDRHAAVKPLRAGFDSLGRRKPKAKHVVMQPLMAGVPFRFVNLQVGQLGGRVRVAKITLNEIHARVA